MSKQLIFDHNIDMQELQHPAEHLTDNYKKEKNSNNYKILDLSHSQHIKLMDNVRLVELWRDMDNAEGITLDRIGRNVLELREGRNDIDYRKAIRIKIRGNLSAGTIEDINTLAQILFEESFDTLRETWWQELFKFEPAAIELSILNTNQTEQQLQNNIDFLDTIARAGGVRLIPHTVFTELFTRYFYHAGHVIETINEHFIQSVPIETAKVSFAVNSFVENIEPHHVQKIQINTKSETYQLSSLQEYVQDFIVQENTMKTASQKYKSAVHVEKVKEVFNDH